MLRFLKKTVQILTGGAAFGLAAALVFVGTMKATGVDAALKQLQEETDREGIEFHAETDMPEEEMVITQSQSVASAQNMSQKQTGTGIPAIVENSMPFIVSITNVGVEEVVSMFGTYEYEATGVGSGIIIGQNEEELLIATNNHVVAGSNELSVCFRDDEEMIVEAKIKGTDVSNDLAIVAVKMSDLTPEIRSTIAIAKLGDSDSLEVGDQVIAIGNSLGYGQSVTTGIVSAKDREVTIDGVTASLIQTDAAINPGNSGGALLNMNGEVIGINSSKFASTKVEGMGYAIPISTAQPILEELMQRQTRDLIDEKEQGILGITCQNVSAELSKMYNIPVGVYVLGTEKGSGAEAAGLRERDVIIAFDGISISDYNELKSTLRYYKVGETVEVTIMRTDENGKYQEEKVAVTLSENTAVKTEASRPQRDQDTESRYGAGDFFGGLFNY